MDVWDYHCSVKHESALRPFLSYLQQEPGRAFYRTDYTRTHNVTSYLQTWFPILRLRTAQSERKIRS